MFVQWIGAIFVARNLPEIKSIFLYFSHQIHFKLCNLYLTTPYCDKEVFNSLSTVFLGNFPRNISVIVQE